MLKLSVYRICTVFPYTEDMDYNIKQHQSPSHKSYKHIRTSKEEDVSVLQKMRAANLTNLFV